MAEGRRDTNVAAVPDWRGALAGSAPQRNVLVGPSPLALALVDPKAAAGVCSASNFDARKFGRPRRKDVEKRARGARVASIIRRQEQASGQKDRGECCSRCGEN